jgi:hypothetical protein
MECMEWLALLTVQKLKEKEKRILPHAMAPNSQSNKLIVLREQP